MNILRPKLRSKIIFTVISIMVYSGIIIVWYLYRFTLSNFVTINKRLFEINTENIAKSTYDEMDETLHTVKIVSLDKSIINYLSSNQTIQDPEVAEQLNLYKKNSDYGTLSLLSATGTVIMSTDNSYVGRNLAFREYFKSAQAGRPDVSLAFGVVTKKPSYYFSSPVFDNNGRFIGVVAAIFDSSKIDKLINIHSDDKQILMLVDKNGIVLSSSKPTRVFNSLGKLPDEKIVEIKKEHSLPEALVLPLGYDPVLSVINNYTSTTIFNFYDEQDGQNEAIVIAKAGALPFYIVNEVRTEDIFGVAYRASFVISLTVFIAILLVSIIIIIFVNRFLRPLHYLQEMALNIGHGYFNQKNLVTSNDEFFDLGVLLEKVSTQLRELYGSLEEKVKERTVELEKANIKLSKSEARLEKGIKISENLAGELLKFKLAVDEASEQIVITDRDGVVIYGNEAVKKITGYSLDEVVGTKAGKLWSKPMPEEYYKKMWKTIRDDKKTFDGEITNRRKNGQLYQAVISISPVLNADREVMYFVGIERDVTIERNIDRAKTEFVSLASHQLRTPLTTVSWYAEIMMSPESGKLSKKQKEYLKEIYDGNKRMINLVNSLLNVSRIELGTFAVDPVPSTVEDRVNETLKELEPEIKIKQLKIKINFDTSIGKIPLDQNLLKILLHNIINNSIKYTDKNGTIKIETKKTGKFVEVIVSDNGCGVPKNEQAKIFDKLFRGTNVQLRDTGGSGLGLYIVKSIVEEAGGKVWFNSEENVGTDFHFTIPLKGMKQKNGSKPLS